MSACAIWTLWVWRTVPADRRLWLDAVFELADRASDTVPPTLRALALRGGAIALLEGDGRVARLYETPVRCGAPSTIRSGLLQRCTVLVTTGATARFEQAESALAESLDLARRSGSSFVLCLALNGFGARPCARPIWYASGFLREPGRGREHWSGLVTVASWSVAPSSFLAAP